MKKIITLVIFILFVATSNVQAGEPLKTLKTEIDQVINILSDPAFKDPSKKEAQRESLWVIINRVFDFKIMSRLTLANNWSLFTPEQQKEFSKVFGRFLGDTYLNKIQSSFSGEQVKYLGDETLTNNRSVVMTKIIGKDREIPIDYNMILTDGKWKIYDVKIEGISLLKNYRSQFGNILINEKPEKLIAQLKSKVKKLD